MPATRFTFDKGDNPIDWFLRIVPITLMFFGIVWCMWFVRRANQQQQTTEASGESTTEEPVNVEKRRAFIETKLVTRTVLSVSAEGNITFSDPIKATEESLHEQPIERQSANEELIKNVSEDETIQKTNNQTSPQELDEEQPLPSKGCSRDDDEESLGASVCNLFSSSSNDEHAQVFQSPSAALRQSCRRPSLIRMLSSALTKEDSHCCDICLAEYQVGDEVCWSPNDDCIHAFHKECILDWTVRNPNCPVCRRNYIGEESV